MLRSVRGFFLPAVPRGYQANDLIFLGLLFLLVNRASFYLLVPSAPPVGDIGMNAVWASAGQEIALIFIGWFYLRRLVGDDLGWFGPSRLQRLHVEQSPAWYQLVGWTLWGGAAACLVAVVGIRALLVELAAHLAVDPWTVNVFSRLTGTAAADGQLGHVAAIAVVAVLLAPLGEELLFRRCLFPIIATGGGHDLVAVLASGVLFAATHGDSVGFLRALVAGLFFAYAYKTTRALVVPLCMHMMYNLLTVAAVLGDWSPWLVP